MSLPFNLARMAPGQPSQRLWEGEPRNTQRSRPLQRHVTLVPKPAELEPGIPASQKRASDPVQCLVLVGSIRKEALQFPVFADHEKRHCMAHVIIVVLTW